VNFFSGTVSRSSSAALDKDSFLHSWCVRGGQGVDPQ
jgi:hypothetical protein